MNKKLFFTPIFALVASAAIATTWVFDSAKYTESTYDISTSLGSVDTDGYWYDLDNPTSYIRASYAPTDTFKIGSQMTLNLDSANLVSNLNISAGNESAIVNLNAGSNNYTITQFTGGTGTINITTKGDLKIINPLESITAGDRPNYLNLEGNTIEIGTSATEKNDIITKTTRTYVSANGNTAARILAGTNSFEAGLANPDIIIHGSAKTNHTFGIKAQTTDNYVRIGGMAGWSSIAREGPYATTTYLILNNSTDFATVREKDWYRIDAVSAWNAGKLAIVMDGTAKQTFYYRELKFNGGVIVRNGTLALNVNQNALKYTFVQNGTLTAWTGKDGAGVQTTYSHGNLTMQGGTFTFDSDTSAGDAAIYGSFRFTNLIYSGGKIALRMAGADAHDSIDLTGYYFRNINGANTTYTFQDGGTVKFADGVTNAKVTFDLGSNLDWLVDFAGDGVKIISWDASNKSALSESDFAANNYGEKVAKFTIADDGLYVKYVAQVPESSTMAALFGLVALAAVLVRRKK